MPSTNKYFNFPNSSINTFKESFNKFLSDLQQTSIVNEFSNSKLKQLYKQKTTPFNWTMDKQSGDIIIDHTKLETEILFTQPSTYNQSLTQNITSKLLPNKEYTISFEFSSDAPVSFELNGIGLQHTTKYTPSIAPDYTYTYNGVKAIIAYNGANTKTRGYFYFVTPSTPLSTTFSVVNTELENKLTVFNFQLQQGLVETYDAGAREFLIDSTKYEYDVWKLTNDGINYQRILTEGDEDKTLQYNFKDEHDNIFYNIGVSGGGLITNPSSILLTEGTSGVGDFVTIDSTFVTAYHNFLKSHIQNPIAGNGQHIFYDLATNEPFSIVTSGFPAYTPILVANNNVTTSTVKAEKFHEAFMVEHNGLSGMGFGGEHTFLNKSVYDSEESSGNFNRHLELSVSSTGNKTVFTTQRVKTGIDINTNLNDIGTWYYESRNKMFHDEDGNHVIHDQLGRMWYLNVRDGDFEFTPKIEHTSDFFNMFESFISEHDVTGTHVFRNRSNGFFYRLGLENGNLTWTRCNFTPISSDISDIELLAIWNKGHDKNGKHYIQDAVLGNYVNYYIDGYGTELASGQVSAYSLVTNPSPPPILEIHPNNITKTFLYEHFINNNIYTLDIHIFDDSFVYSDDFDGNGTYWEMDISGGYA